MREQFIPYELALKLKELGFNEECFGVYVNGKFEPRYRSINSKFNPNKKLDKRNLEFCTTPLWQQCFDWLRGKYNLNIHIYKTNKMHNHFGYDIFDLLEFRTLKMSTDCYDTYQEARQACLEKLIEIVENGSN